MSSGVRTAAAVAHVVQTALAPVFMLSGVGILPNVLATCLARVSEQTDSLSLSPCQGETAARFAALSIRSRVLEFSVVSAAMAAALTCASVFVLFVGALLERPAATLLFGLFGGAVLLTMLAIVGFVVEMLLAAEGVRRRVDRSMSATQQVGSKSF